MRTFSFICSIMAFTATLFYLVTDFPSLENLNGIIYLSMLAVLLLICITGIIINWPHISMKVRKNLGKGHDTVMH